MQDGRKAVWSIKYVSGAFLKQNFIAYSSSKVSDFIFEVRQLCESGFSRVYSNFCCSCSFEPETIKIGQLSHKMYGNNILNFQDSTIILNAHTIKVRKFIVCTLYNNYLDLTQRGPRGVTVIVIISVTSSVPGWGWLPFTWRNPGKGMNLDIAAPAMGRWLCCLGSLTLVGWRLVWQSLVNNINSMLTRSDACSIKIICIGNGSGDPSSNLWRGWLHCLWHLYHL